MISGTTIVWCGTQDSTIMDGRHTSGIFTVQTKFPPMLQLPVRAILPHLPSVLSAPSCPGPSSCSLPSTPRRTRDIKNYVDAINDDGHPHDLFMAQGGFAIDE